MSLLDDVPARPDAAAHREAGVDAGFTLTKAELAELLFERVG